MTELTVEKIVASGAKPAAAKPKAEKAAAPAKKALPKLRKSLRPKKPHQQRKLQQKSAAVDYTKMTVAELKAAAKGKGIAGYTSLKKAELIAALSK